MEAVLLLFSNQQGMDVFLDVCASHAGKECMCHEHVRFSCFLLKNASNKLPAVKGAQLSVAGGGSCSAVEKKRTANV